MGFYDSAENVEKYIEMAEGYNGKELIQRLDVYLPKGSSVLEIGMGPGVDLKILEVDYKAVGSDNSEIFINRYLDLNPGADLLVLDAVTLKTERRFYALFSNKVLHHLSYEEMGASFRRQAEVLEPNGIMMHSFWYGEEIENYEGLMFHQITEKKLESILPPCFEILEMKRYTEMEEMDSLYGIFRLK